MKAIYLGSIIRGQFFGWQLFGSNYQQSIIPPGNSLSANCPRTNYLGGNYRGTNFWEVIVRGAITLGGQLYAGNCPGGNYPKGVIVLFPVKHVKGYDIARKLNKCKLFQVFVKTFSRAKAWCLKDHMKPSLRKNPDRFVLDIETSDLNSDRSPENIAKSIQMFLPFKKMIHMMQAYQILLLTTQVNENLENCV